MTEVLFYHLERQPLERVLPELLEKCLERGWRAVVQVGSDERSEALDGHLWTYRTRFLPHGTARTATPRTAGLPDHRGRQPQRCRPCAFWPTAPNRRTCRLSARGLLFDGSDAEAVDKARGPWKARAGRRPRRHLLAAERARPLGEEGVRRRKAVSRPSPPPARPGGEPRFLGRARAPCRRRNGPWRGRPRRPDAD